VVASTKVESVEDLSNHFEKVGNSCRHASSEFVCKQLDPTDKRAALRAGFVDYFILFF